MSRARALTIAGSDPTGGAGIQQDLKTFDALGVWGGSAITAVTVQDTLSVARWESVDPLTVRDQLVTVARDMQFDAAKTGMLATAKIAEAVGEAIEELGIEKLVVDPVLVAGSGAALSTDDLVGALKDAILPRALLITPNAQEAETLSGLSVKTRDEQREVAVVLAALGPRAVLVTGGHLDGDDVVDVLFVDDEIHEISTPRVDAGPVHGTGCLLSAAITARLAHGDAIEEAVMRARRVLDDALHRAVAIGKGARVLEARA
jgi:hydroxymethylpyrimidine/phosphomethylpyrimidine kinase